MTMLSVVVCCFAGCILVGLFLTAIVQRSPLRTETMLVGVLLCVAVILSWAF